MNFSLPQNTHKGQREAVNADDKIITVSAGAGTGKTWVLSNRYARLLLQNETLMPSEILTLTFTEAAAAEMKTRIISKVEEELGKNKNPDDTARKQEILDGLTETWISTIHAFAGRLIRESGLSLDIDPTANVITPQQEQEFWENIRNAVEFANLRELARTYGDKNLRDSAEFLDKDAFMTNAVNKWKSTKLSEFARDVAELHASSGKTWHEMLEWSENDFFVKKNSEAENKVKKILEAEWLDVWNFFSGTDLPEAKKPNGPGGNLNALLNWQKLNSPNDIEALKFFYDSIVADPEKKLSNGRGEPFKTFKEIKEISFSDWRKARPSLLKEISLDFGKDFSQEELWMRRILLKFCAVSWGMWDMMKQRRGLLSFSDMILHAKNAIEKESVKHSFKHILVDEFQDTDGLQFEMITSLTKNQDTNLFAVGDIKQSIYRFRHADPSLFSGTIKTADRKIDLDKSFRTRKSLLEKINKIFSSLWQNSELIAFRGLDASDSAFERDFGTMPPFKIFLTQNTGGLSAVRKNLAEELASNISKWVGEERTIWDKSEKIIRPVKFSDFTILSRTRTVFSSLEEALEKFGIPSIRDRSEDFFTRGEIGDVVCMLRAAADANDSFSVMGWLMSPFSEIPEKDAVEKIFMNAGKKINFPELLKKNFPEAYSRLEYLSLIGTNEGPAGLLSIFNKNRRWLSCYPEKDRLRVLRNFRLALSMSRAFQQSGTSSLTACAEWLTRAVRRELKIEEPKWHDENENAVHLTAVHSSKGLEYPVTIIFDTQKSKKPNNKPLSPSRDLGIVFSDFPDEFNAAAKPFAVKWENLLSEQGELEEEERLFYVAATRAQDSLIFCGTLSKDGEPYKNSWTEFLLDNVEAEEKNKIEFAVGTDAPEIQKKIEADEKNLTSVNVIRAKNSLRQFSASAFSLFEWCPFAWRRRYRQGQTLSWELTEREDEFEDFTGGANLGSLAHWILSRWLTNENFEAELEYFLNDREMISRLPAHLRGVWRDKKNKAALREWLLTFAASEPGITLRTRKDVKREHRFMLSLGNTALAGAIDALYENNLIDYKITSIDNAPSGLYESQLDFYAFVAHTLTGNDEIKTTTAFLRENIFEGHVCKNFDEIKSRIFNAAEICASGDLKPKREHCAACPFKGGCAFFKVQEVKK